MLEGSLHGYCSFLQGTRLQVDLHVYSVVLLGPHLFHGAVIFRAHLHLYSRFAGYCVVLRGTGLHMYSAVLQGIVLYILCVCVCVCVCISLFPLFVPDVVFHACSVSCSGRGFLRVQLPLSRLRGVPVVCQLAVSFCRCRLHVNAARHYSAVGEVVAVVSLGTGRTR